MIQYFRKTTTYRAKKTCVYSRLRFKVNKAGCKNVFANICFAEAW